MTLFTAGALECLQVLVVSRVCDVTDILLAGCGAAVGVGIGNWLRRHAGAMEPEAPARARTWRREAAAFAVVWLLVLGFYAWYPFDFHVSASFLRGRLLPLRPPPFTFYFLASPVLAIAQAVQKALFFAPLGAAAAVLSARFDGTRRGNASVLVSVLALVLVALVVELGQALLPGRLPDLTDVMIEVVGGAGGFWAAWAIWRRRTRGQRASESSNDSRPVAQWFKK